MEIFFLIIGLLFGYTFKSLFIDENLSGRKFLGNWKDKFPYTRYHYSLMETLYDCRRVGYSPQKDECNLMFDLWTGGIVTVISIFPENGTSYVLSPIGEDLYSYYRDNHGGVV